MAADRRSGKRELAGSVVRWISQRLAARKAAGSAAGDGPGRTPAPVRRGRWKATREARRAVRAGVQMGEYLRFRLAHYLAALPIPASELPVTLALESGDLLGTAQARPPPPGRAAASGEERARRDWPPPAVRREIEDAEAELRRIDGHMAEQDARVAQLARSLDQAISQGTAAVQGLEALPPEQAGRPHVGPPWALASCAGLAGLLLVAEAWQLASRYLAGRGIRVIPFPGLAAHGLEIGFTLLLSLGVALTLVLAARLALRPLLAAWERASRETWLAGALAGSAVLAAGCLWSAMPSGEGAAPGPARTRLAFAFFTVLVPFAVAWLSSAAAGLRAERAALLERARTWDEEYMTVIAERTRREELLQRAAAERDRLRAERDSVRAALERLLRRAELQASVGAGLEPLELLRIANSLHAALELDRFSFVREASRRGARSLLGPAPARPLLERGPEPSGIRAAPAA